MDDWETWEENDDLGLDDGPIDEVTEVDHEAEEALAAKNALEDERKLKEEEERREKEKKAKKGKGRKKKNLTRFLREKERQEQSQGGALDDAVFALEQQRKLNGGKKLSEQQLAMIKRMKELNVEKEDGAQQASDIFGKDNIGMDDLSDKLDLILSVLPFKTSLDYEKLAISLKKRFEYGGHGSSSVGVNTAQVTMFLKECVRLLGELLSSSQVGDVSKACNTLKNDKLKQERGKKKKKSSKPTMKAGKGAFGLDDYDDDDYDDYGDDDFM